MTSAPTHVVVLTPPGRGAVATVLVSGPRATCRVGELFHPARPGALDEQPLGRILYGRWRDADSGEEVVVCRRDDRRVEVHCHGGAAAAQAIVASLAERGCAAVEWPAWIRLSAHDPIAAEALIALARAPTERAAAILWDQHNGALRGALDGLAAALDAGDVPRAREQLAPLLTHAPVGLHLLAPWRVVLAGRPNVGKSSLINALVGYQRAIVHATPGTTRDLVTVQTAMDGWPVELVDTAGLHASAHPIESAGIRLAREQLKTADLVLLVYDASQRWTSDDAALHARHASALVIHNKSDLAGSDANADRPPGLQTNALGSQGIAELAAEVGRRLVPHPPNPGEAVPFQPDHVATLQQISQALASDQLLSARRLLTPLERADSAPS